MALSVPSQSKIPTKSPQLGIAGAARPAPAKASRVRRSAGGGSARVSGETREATRGDDRVVVEVAGGVTVYPARGAGDRWRAVWYEGGRRRQCESVSEAGLAAKLEKVTERLVADAPGMERPGSDLIAFYLSPDRHPAGRAWSRKHADTQRCLFVSSASGGLPAAFELILVFSWAAGWVVGWWRVREWLGRRAGIWGCEPAALATESLPIALPGSL